MATEEFPRKQMETLWAPWRVEYFEKEPRDRNFLETAARASNDAEHFVITRRKNSFLMMNRYPYAVGHLMAVPYRKTAELSSLGEKDRKSTRLNSSHRTNSYAVFCLKKKKQEPYVRPPPDRLLA